MKRRLNIAVVDADKSVHVILKGFFKDSQIAQTKYHFTDSRKFISESPLLDFDICLLEVDIPVTDGLTIAQLLEKKPFIFITGNYAKLKDALELEPIDIVTKPISKQRLEHALIKASKLIDDKIEYAFFNVAENKKKIKISVKDILYSTVQNKDPRNKIVILKSAKKYTLMGCSFDHLLWLAPHLVQPNRKELIATTMINEIIKSSVTIRNNHLKVIPGELPLSRTFKKDLFKRIAGK